ncbi:MAG: secondary thiamine-phosphate synthase enzyme YjbQ [Hespellia sp.]|nr:secondary thiamine-phosphate synthase enzyme YjbQ [Hespellia sp.]
MNLFDHHIATSHPQQMSKITNMIREDIEKSGVRDGIIVVFSPHTTAGFTINENADPDVVHDILMGFEKVFPTQCEGYQHAEGNSHAHMKTTVVGPSQTLILQDGEILFGMWQDVYFCEFDGPRNRTFYVKIIAG